MKKILTGLLAAATLFVLAPSAIRAQIFTDKYISGGPDANGNYTLTLESFVTGEVTITESQVPADIVLVLDYSSSMLLPAAYDRTFSTTPISHSGGWKVDDIVNNEIWKQDHATEGQYYLHTDGQYYYVKKELKSSQYQVYVDLPEGRRYFNVDNLSSDPCYYSSKNDVCWTGDLYACLTATVAYTKAEGLRRAVLSFVESMSQKSIATGLAHRLAMVLFNNRHYKNVQFPNLMQPHLGEYNYNSQTLDGAIVRKDFTDLSNTADVNTLRSLLSVDNIPIPESSSNTYLDGGLSLAHGLFRREASVTGIDLDGDGTVNDYETPKNNLGEQYAKRPKVVIIVCDGVTQSSEYAMADFIKDAENKCTYQVYGSSPTHANNNYGGATIFYVVTNPNKNEINQEPASNYWKKIRNDVGTILTDNAEGNNADQDQYILTAEEYDADLIDGLIDMSEIIGGADIDLGPEAVVQDVITPEFRFATGTEIELYTADCTGTDGDGGLVFSSTETSFAGTVTGPTFNETDKTTTIRVTGFDYSGNWCGDHGGGVYSGKKLIMKLKVKLSDPDNDLVGGLLYTNTEDSVILEGETVVAPFPRPTVWIPIHLQIVKSGLLKDDSAVFAIWRKPVDGTDFETAPYMRVILTGTDGSDVSADITNLDPAYIYKIVETDWSWHYTPGVTERLSTSQTRNPFLFDNTLKTGLPKSAEDVQRNKFF